MNLTELKEIRQKNCAELMHMARQIKLAGRGQKFALCSIINAKSGQCSEDCSFCVQSAHYKTKVDVYPIKPEKEIIEAAYSAKKAGAHHFSLVTSGRGAAPKEVDKLVDIIAAIRDQVDIPVCASLGILGRKDFVRLKDAGMSRYHHNLETSREFFKKIVSTHSFEERLDTISAAKEEGIEVCSGGIFGLGESEDDRVSMALTLKEYEVDSVPINILIPLPGTPLAKQPALPVIDVLRSIALYRIILPAIPIRLAAGRETVLQDFLSSAFMAGADGMMVGGYLTERGRSVEKDMKFVEQIKEIWGQ